MTIPISNIVDVQITIAAAALSSVNFGLSNIVGFSQKLPLGNRIKEYSSSTDVLSDFATTDPEYLASVIYFSQQNPRPDRVLISRAFAAGSGGELWFPNPISNNSTWTAITAGTLNLSINIGGTDTPIALTGLNFSGVQNLNGVANIIQTALISQAASAFGANGTVKFVGGAIVITQGIIGAGNLWSKTAITGTIASLLTNSTNPLSYPGVAVESITDTLNALVKIRNDWYGFGLTKNDDGTVAAQNLILGASAWCEAQGGTTNPHYFFYASLDNSILLSAQTADIFSKEKALLYKKSAGWYDPDDLYIQFAPLGIMSGVNWDAQNAAPTLAFKSAVGNTATTSITSGDVTILASKNANAYVQYGTLFSGLTPREKSADGSFIDAVWGVDVLTIRLQDAIANFLKAIPTKLPYTNEGANTIVGIIDQNCANFVNNGLLAPGTWNGLPLGKVQKGDFVPKGYYIYCPDINKATQAQRDTRILPPIQLILLGAGAIEGVRILGTFQN